MSLIHMDFPSGSQGMYGTTLSRLTNGVYAQVGDFSSMALSEDPDPNITGVTVRITPGAGWTPLLRFVLPSNQTKVGIARRVWLPSLPSSASFNQTVAEWRNGANSTLGTVTVDNTGRLIITVGASVTTSAVPWIVANTWQHIESYMDTTAGTVYVRVEGFNAISVTGLTITGPIAQVVPIHTTAGGSSNPASQYMKDLVLWDGSGSQNNDWIGPVQVFDLTPNSDISSGWTSTGATNYEVLDESPPNDADYISAGASPLPSPSIVGLSDLPDSIIGVRGLMSFTRAWKTDGGDATLVVGLSPNGTNWDNGTDIPVSTAASYWRRISEVSPATSSPWTPIEVNDARLRFNRTV